MRPPAFRTPLASALAMSISLVLLFPPPATADPISISVTAPDGAVVGTVDVDTTFDGTGVEGGFTSTYGAVPSLAAAAAKCGVDHFNWFQVLLDVSQEDPVSIDPPLGGSASTWADNLSWYWDEGSKPVPEPANWKDGYLLSDHSLDVNGDSSDEYLGFLDYPSSTEPTPLLAFTTHLVGLNADGSLHSIYGGFAWDYLGITMFEGGGAENRTRSIDPPALPGIATLRESDSAGGGYLWYNLAVGLLPGDTNLDGFVDEQDAQALSQNWGSKQDEDQESLETVNWTMGDFNFDGAVGPLDAAVLAANWTGSGPAETTPMPEPSVLVVVLSAFGAFVFRRRR